MIEFYSGTDLYRLRSALPIGMVIDFSHPDESVELERTLKYPSFFEEHHTVIVRGIFSDADTADTFLGLLKTYDVSGLDTITLLVCREGDGGRESAATKALAAYLAKHATRHTTFDPLKGIELTAWIKDYCGKRQCDIDPQASLWVVHQTGGDSWLMANELAKLCAYASGEVITPDMARLLVPARQEQNDFALSHALSVGNKRQALVALWRRLSEGAPEQLILGLIAYSFRTLLTRNGPGMEKIQRAHACLAVLDRTAKDGRADAQDGLYGVILDM